MSRGVGIPQRIVARVAIAVQALRVARACPERDEGSRHNRVGLDKAGVSYAVGKVRKGKYPVQSIAIWSFE